MNRSNIEEVVKDTVRNWERRLYQIVLQLHAAKLTENTDSMRALLEHATESTEKLLEDLTE